MGKKIILSESAYGRLTWAFILMFYGGTFIGLGGCLRDWKGWHDDAYISFFIGIGLVIVANLMFFIKIERLSTDDIKESEKQPSP